LELGGGEKEGASGDGRVGVPPVAGGLPVVKGRGLLPVVEGTRMLPVVEGTRMLPVVEGTRMLPVVEGLGVPPLVVWIGLLPVVEGCGCFWWYNLGEVLHMRDIFGVDIRGRVRGWERMGYL